MWLVKRTLQPHVVRAWVCAWPARCRLDFKSEIAVISLQLPHKPPRSESTCSDTLHGTAGHVWFVMGGNVDGAIIFFFFFRHPTGVPGLVSYTSTFQFVHRSKLQGTFKQRTKFKCLNGIAPPYPSDMFHLRQSHRQGLRSYSDKTRLNTHKSRLTYGKHAFSHSAAELWNNLPINVRYSSCVVTFKKKLKTYLFPKL